MTSRSGIGAAIRRRSTGMGVANLVAVLVLYYAVPVDDEASLGRLLVNGLLTLAALATVGMILVREARSEVRGEEGALRGLQLVLLFEIVFVLFALVYYSLAVHAPDQMAGVETRTDALYFTAATMATVGYGDVHPDGQLARAVATAHIVFDVVFLAAFARLLSAGFARRHRDEGEA